MQLLYHCHPQNEFIHPYTLPTSHTQIITQNVLIFMWMFVDWKRLEGSVQLIFEDGSWDLHVVGYWLLHNSMCEGELPTTRLSISANVIFCCCWGKPIQTWMILVTSGAEFTDDDVVRVSSLFDCLSSRELGRLQWTVICGQYHVLLLLCWTNPNPDAVSHRRSQICRRWRGWCHQSLLFIGPFII